MAEPKLRLLSLSERETRILLKLVRESNPPMDEQQDVINISIKLQKLNE